MPTSVYVYVLAAGKSPHILKIYTFVYIFLTLGRVSMATLAIAQPEYSINEGGGSVSTGLVCIDLVSIQLAQGASAIDGVTVTISIVDVRGDDTTLEEFNSTISLGPLSLGRSVFCALPTFPDDNIVQGDIQFLAFASVVVLGRDSVTFVPQRARAVITVTDDEGITLL